MAFLPTLEDWNKREDFQEKWEEFFRSDCGQAGIQILLQSQFPILVNAGNFKADVDLRDSLAIAEAQRQGYFSFAESIESLYRTRISAHKQAIERNKKAQELKPFEKKSLTPTE